MGELGLTQEKKDLIASMFAEPVPFAEKMSNLQNEWREEQAKVMGVSPVLQPESDPEHQPETEAPEDIEELANGAHRCWADWMLYLFSKCQRTKSGTMVIPAWAVERWERQATTDYRFLSESEKEADREVVRKYYLRLGKK